jgi:hypothetical protein
MPAPRLIWTSEPDAIEGGEITLEITVRRPLSGILLKLSAERRQRPVDVAADLFDGILRLVECNSLSQDEYDELFEKIYYGDASSGNENH